jgi:hypothetical protein
VIVGGIIEIFDENGNLVGRGLTGADGTVCIPNIPEGPVFVVGRVPDCPGALQCQSRLARAVVVANQTTQVNLALICRAAQYFLPHIERGATWNVPNRE